MRSKIIVSLIFVIILLHAKLSFAECVDIGSVVNWSFIDNHTIIIYSGSSPAARVEITECFVQQTSNIRLIQGRVCARGKMLIDGKSCYINNVDSKVTQESK